MQKRILQVVWGSFYRLKKDVLAFLFPELCSVCEIRLPDGLNSICLACASDLHYTFFESYKESTLLDELFWGRVQLCSTFSLLYFAKGGSTQAIVHAIKYKNNQDLAINMGGRMGEKLLLKWKENRPDCILSVPLHPKKLNKRGYNQSELLAEGLSAYLNIPFYSAILARRKHSQTQTKKGKMERWDNVREIFEVKSAEEWKNKHLCIVDDVITTGATIEACVRVLQNEIEGCKISVISLAFAK